MQDLINKLNQSIDIEYDAKNVEVEETLKLPVEERVIKGDSINNIQVHFSPIFSSKGDIHFKTAEVICQNENISKFREGNPVILHNGQYSFELNVEADSSKKMILQSGYHTYIVPQQLQNSQGWFIDNAKVDIRNIVKKSTAILAADQRKRNYISGIFSGDILPQFSKERLEKGKQLADQTQLNPTQQEAFMKAYATENYYLIQGPPGTGKTWLLAHLAEAFAKEGNKVLITASTHTAINNALQKTSELSQYPDIIKVGKSHQKENLNYNGSTAKNITDFRRSSFDNQSKGIIVGATCYSPQTKKLEFMDWDIIIIDEAGQLSIPLAVAAMVKGKKFIFIGDHKQLPPIISQKQKDPVFSKSVFELLFQHAPGVMLDVTYRMNQSINRFPSRQFYQGHLLPHPQNVNWKLNISDSFDRHAQILDPNQPEVLYCHFHQSNSTRSPFEANLAAELVQELTKKGVPESEIAIITPFRAQVRQIKNAFDAFNIGENIFVDTIERIQGQEREVIIFSMATSNPIKAKQRATFVFNPNRLNVALTRAKKKRIVIANRDLFKLTTDDPELQPLLAVFQAFYKDAFKVEESTVGEGLF